MIWRSGLEVGLIKDSLKQGLWSPGPGVRHLFHTLQGIYKKGQGQHLRVFGWVFRRIITIQVRGVRFPPGDSFERLSHPCPGTSMCMAKGKGNPEEQVLEDKDSLKDGRFYVTDLCAKGLRRLAFQARARHYCRTNTSGQQRDLS